MPKRKRFVIFCIFLIFFVIFSGSLIAYSQGYRFDKTNLKFIRTGGIYVVSTPSNAQVRLNGKLIKRPKLSLSSGFLIDKLLPKTYELEIAKEGFQSWYRQVTVRSGMVNSYQNVVLFPQNITARRVDGVNKNQILFSSGKTIYLQISTRPASDNKQIKETFIKIRNNSTNETVATPLATSSDLKILQASNKQQFILLQQGTLKPHWFIFDSSNGRLANLSQIAPQGKFNTALFSPQNETNILFETETKLQSIDVSNRQIKTLLQQSTAGFTVRGNQLYYIDTASGSLISITDTPVSRQLIAPIEEYLLNSESRFSISTLSKERFLLWSETDNLLYVSRSAKTPIKIIDDHVLEVAVDPDERKIAYIKKTKRGVELWVYYLENDGSTGLEQTADSKIFIASSLDPVTQLSWYKNKGSATHLVYINGSRLTVTDTDSRNRINNFTLVTPATKYYYDSGAKILRWIDENTLWETQL